MTPVGRVHWLFMASGTIHTAQGLSTSWRPERLPWCEYCPLPYCPLPYRPCDLRQAAQLPCRSVYLWTQWTPFSHGCCEDQMSNRCPAQRKYWKYVSYVHFFIFICWVPHFNKWNYWIRLNITTMNITKLLNPISAYGHLLQFKIPFSIHFSSWKMLLTHRAKRNDFIT